MKRFAAGLAVVAVLWAPSLLRASEPTVHAHDALLSCAIVTEAGHRGLDAWAVVPADVRACLLYVKAHR